jgi:hypothetical protein
MDPPEFSLMLEHYFQVELSNEQRARLKNAIDPRKGKPHLNLTPAQVEQLAAEHEEIDDMLTALEKKGHAPIAASCENWWKSPCYEWKHYTYNSKRQL